MTVSTAVRTTPPIRNFSDLFMALDPFTARRGVSAEGKRD